MPSFFFHRRLAPIAVITLLATGCAQSLFLEGERAYEAFRYQEAIEDLTRLVEKWPEDTSALRLLSRSHLMINQYEEAAQSLRQLESMGALSPEDKVAFAQTKMNMQAYDEAAELLEGMILDQTKANLAAAFLASCLNIQEIRSDTSIFELQKVNVPGLRTAAGPTRSGDFVYFTGQSAVGRVTSSDPYNGLSYTDLYRSRLDEVGDVDWVPEPINEINSPYHDGYACFGSDGTLMALSRTNTGETKRLKVNSESVSTIQIYYSEWEGEQWATPRPFPFNESESMFAHPTILPDGKGLIFASDMPGPNAQGGMDLWYTRKNGDFWTIPTNLGPAINTPGNELFPSMRHPDTLWFSSNGHRTLGGLDVLYAIRDAEKDTLARDRDPNNPEYLPPADWLAPIHLNYPLNTASDDFGVVLDDQGLKGYLSSDRDGLDALYRFAAEPRPIRVLGRTLVDGEETPVGGADIVLIDAGDGSSISFTTNADGKFEIELPRGRIYRIQIQTDGFFVEDETIATSKDPLVSSMEVDLTLISLLRLGDEDFVRAVLNGEPFELPEVFWDFDRATVRDAAKPSLQTIANFLKEHEKVILEVQSHCDSRGSDGYNEKLSQRRADAIESHLLNIGVDPDQIVSIGAGEYRLRNHCDNDTPCSEALHQENRRTEFRVMGLMED